MGTGQSRGQPRVSRGLSHRGARSGGGPAAGRSGPSATDAAGPRRRSGRNEFGGSWPRGQSKPAGLTVQDLAIKAWQRAGAIEACRRAMVRHAEIAAVAGG